MDASSYDEICEICGATDIAGGGWGDLRFPCVDDLDEKIDPVEKLTSLVETVTVDRDTLRRFNELLYTASEGCIEGFYGDFSIDPRLAETIAKLYYLAENLKNVESLRM